MTSERKAKEQIGEAGILVKCLEEQQVPGEPDIIQESGLGTQCSSSRIETIPDYPLVECAGFSKDKTKRFVEPGRGEKSRRTFTNDSTDCYLNEALRIPLLTAEEEVDLAKKIADAQDASKELDQDGHDLVRTQHLEQVVEEGRQARERLILANSRLVVSVAKKCTGRGVPFLDLVQEGNIGLMKAIEKFDYTKGYRFSTYATWWIRQAISRAIADQGRTVRIPVYMEGRISEFRRQVRRIAQELGREPTLSDITKHLGLSDEEVRRILEASEKIVSLNRALDRDEDDAEFGDFVEDNNPGPDAIVQDRDLSERVEEVLDSLTPREAIIIKFRFGFKDGRTYTLEEVGEKLKLSKERIRQIEAEALGKLRHPLRSGRLRDYT